MLFDPLLYGTLVGQLIVPGFILSAIAPLAYVLVIERFGAPAALWLSTVIALPTLLAALLLKRRR